MKQLHPDYGLPEDFRRAVVATAGLLGARAAALAHSVSITSVYNWINWYSKN